MAFPCLQHCSLEPGIGQARNTFKKHDYDTYENQELIELNNRLFREAGYKGNYLVEFSPEAMKAVARRYGQTDPRPDVESIDRGEEHWLSRRPLYRSPRNSLVKHIKAILIYLRDYWERVDVAGESE